MAFPVGPINRTVTGQFGRGMKEVNRADTGTIVLVTGNLGRYGAFEDSLHNLYVPRDTTCLRLKSGAAARMQNIGVRKRRGGWVWFIDDDHTFEPDTLLRLLDHNKEIIAPLVPSRIPPFDFVLYKTLDVLEHDGKVVSFSQSFYTPEDLTGYQGLLQVQGLPKAGCLIRESLWARMPDPWFRVGLFEPDDVQDDRYFMWEVRTKYAAELWCDLDLGMTHINTFAVGHKRDEELQYSIRMVTV
ncbi:MAG: glycosyltransferase [Nitrososphaera sp.]|nr:glycosyltransferase [Nitrososphaera sp.]